ncbi:DNA repair protein [Micromonospora sp. NPDC048830]|uniref:DNA repair protein n=1 Tax=Micromonospora sp. NPDC048830 TaxID=3364257 RepID=UPI0037240693
MPNLPDDRHQQEAQRWRAVPRFPAQPPYREARAARATEPALSWAELDRQPAGASIQPGLNAR